MPVTEVKAGACRMNQKERPRDLTDMKRELAANDQTIVFTCRIRVERKPELQEDPDMFRLYWKRRLSKALEKEGEVRFLVLV